MSSALHTHDHAIAPFITSFNGENYVNFSYLGLIDARLDKRRDQHSWRKVKTWLSSYLSGSEISVENVCFPRGLPILKDTDTWIRRDVFDMIVICTPANIINWTISRVSYINQRYPSMSVPGPRTVLQQTASTSTVQTVQLQVGWKFA